MMKKKKKARTTRPKAPADQAERRPTIRYQLPVHYLTSRVLSNIVQDELLHQSPVTHIDPSEYTPARLQALIAQASR